MGAWPWLIISGAFVSLFKGGDNEPYFPIICAHQIKWDNEGRGYGNLSKH